MTHRPPPWEFWTQCHYSTHSALINVENGMTYIETSQYISQLNYSNSKTTFGNFVKFQKEIFDSTFKKSFQKLAQPSSKCRLWLCFICAYLGLPVCNSIRSAYFCLVSFADVFANVFYICVDYKNIIIYTTSSHMSHLCIFTSADCDWLGSPPVTQWLGHPLLW